MIIRKKFRFEAAHIVRECTSQLCRENIHGHSYIVEVFVEGTKLDNGCMVMDFCLLDGVKKLIDAFDHSYCLWHKESDDYKAIMRKVNKRLIEMPISPSAEGYALLFFVMIDDIVEAIPHNNGEGEVLLSSVRVHETETGYAEAFRKDKALADFTSADVKFSV
jgi:6-pyruvoyltetrahydropterin/6-carboxytetrahydropterin synthase